MTCDQIKILARGAKAFTTFVAASLLLLSCAETHQAYDAGANPTEIPESVLITGSLVRDGGASQYPPSAVYLRHQGAKPAPAPPPFAFVYQGVPENTENYPAAKPNPVKVAAQEPVSTFSI